MMNLRKNKVGDCRIKGIMSRKTQLRMFISWALPAFCTVAAAAGTPVYSVGVATAGPKPHLASSSSLWRANDDKSYKRLLQETEVQAAATAEVHEDDHDDHDHTDEEGHDDHKDELTDHAEDEHHDHAEDDHDDHGTMDHHDDHEDDHAGHDHDDHGDDHADHHDDHDDHDDHSDHDDHEDHDAHLHGGAETMNAENKPVNNVWGAVIGATLLVNLATFSGVLILVIPAVQQGYLKYRGVPGTPGAVAGKGGRMLDIVMYFYPIREKGEDGDR